MCVCAGRAARFGWSRWANHGTCSKRALQNAREALPERNESERGRRRARSLSHGVRGVWRGGGERSAATKYGHEARASSPPPPLRVQSASPSFSSQDDSPSTHTTHSHTQLLALQQYRHAPTSDRPSADTQRARKRRTKPSLGPVTTSLGAPSPFPRAHTQQAMSAAAAAPCRCSAPPSSSWPVLGGGARRPPAAAARLVLSRRARGARAPLVAHARRSSTAAPTTSTSTSSDCYVGFDVGASSFPTPCSGPSCVGIGAGLFAALAFGAACWLKTRQQLGSGAAARRRGVGGGAGGRMAAPEAWPVVSSVCSSVPT